MPSMKIAIQLTAIIVDNVGTIITAKGKNWNNCGILSQFAKMCRKSKTQQNQSSSTQHKTVNQTGTTPQTSKRPLNQFSADLLCHQTPDRKQLF